MNHQACFLLSSPIFPASLPAKPTFAFIGRSNVGKSSLVNMLLERKQLAHTSSRPGKTQWINYFEVDGCWYIVDLPGYGFARVGKAKKKQLPKMLKHFLAKATPLYAVGVLVDIRIPPQEQDIAFLEWLGRKEIPCMIIFTKYDGVRSHIARRHIEAFQEAMLRTWQTLPPFFITSSKEKKGRDALLDYMNRARKGKLDAHE